MRTNKLLFAALILAGGLAITSKASAQACSVAGQTPATAFPVCGTAAFSQFSVPVCTNGPAPSPTCVVNARISYEALNPFWYKFTCFKAGTLGFLIKPNSGHDDYDWELFDVTNQPVNNILNNANAVVASNWSGVFGNTGTSATATALYECASTEIPATSPPPFSKMPDLVLGHEYLLLVSHFSGSDQSGYNLTFNGGTASITDTTPPAIKSASPICDGTRIQIALNKNMQCSTLAADGSDFTLSPAPPGVKITGAYAVNCSGFELDTLVVVTNGPLPTGDYSIVVNQGTDGNSILDICGSPIPVGQKTSFHMVPPGPTPMDSIAPVGCAPDVLRLVFAKQIECPTIAADGSDFTVTGSTPVTVVGAYGQCDTGNRSYSVFVKLSAPLVKAGSYRIFLAPGSDGNTLIDECGFTSPPGSLPFTTGDTVSAKLMTDQLLLGCKTDTIIYHYPDANGVNRWQWIFDGSDTSLLQDPAPRFYSVFGTKNVRLVVSNDYCSDTASFSPVLGNAIKAALEVPNILCPKDNANYLNKSTGDLNSFTWDFGDGSGFSGETPSPHLYPLTGIETVYPVTLIVGNALGCYDTAAQSIDVLRSCYIAVPGAFTPNGDGLNDYLYPLNAYKADNLTFKVFNRFGQMVFEMHEWTQKWDGTLHGNREPAGAYVWFLDYTDRDTGKHVFQKGTSILIR